jgi:hypothetical protein
MEAMLKSNLKGVSQLRQSSSPQDFGIVILVLENLSGARPRHFSVAPRRKYTRKEKETPVGTRNYMIECRLCNIQCRFVLENPRQTVIQEPSKPELY